MSSTARGWLIEDIARHEIDRAIAKCKRDHCGRLLGEPNCLKRTMLRDNGSEFDVLVLFVDDTDGWWGDYANERAWQALSGVQYERIDYK